MTHGSPRRPTMTRCGPLVLALLCAGCSVYEPRPDPFDELDAPATAATLPLETPELPEMVPVGDGLGFVDADGVVLAEFGGVFARQLAELLVVANGNERAARLNAEALNEAAAAFDDAVTAGHGLHDLAESRGRRLAISERDRAIEKTVLYLLIGVVGAAGAL